MDEPIRARDVAGALHRFGSLEEDLRILHERLTALEAAVEDLEARLTALEEERRGR
jgi:predicted  nucleic acid-binding Zn-ribbon protein